MNQQTVINEIAPLPMEERAFDFKATNERLPERELFVAVLLAQFEDACKLLPPKPAKVSFPAELHSFSADAHGNLVVRPIRGAAHSEEMDAGGHRRRKHHPAMEQWRAYCKAKKERTEAISNRNEAREYLLSNSESFREVCMFAGFDSEYVLDKVKKLEARKWLLPASPCAALK